MVLHWIIGRTGSGKTRYAHDFAADDSDNLVLVQTGVACRKRFGALAMAESENPLAPAETEVFVRQLVSDSIRDAREKNLDVVIDSMPRSPAQVRWIQEETTSDMFNVFHFVTCDDDVRKQRIHERDIDEDDYRLSIAKEQKESTQLLRVLEEIHIRFKPLELVVVDQTHDPVKGTRGRTPSDCVDVPAVESVRVDYSVGAMLRANDAFSDITLSELGVKMNNLYNAARSVNQTTIMSETSLWTRRFVERAIDELKELLENIPVEWWNHDQVDVRKCRVELIDAWHFILSAIRSLGMDEQTFAETYFAKRSINLKRQANGYLKRIKVKGDDDDVGRF